MEQPYSFLFLWSNRGYQCLFFPKAARPQGRYRIEMTRSEA